MEDNAHAILIEAAQHAEQSISHIFSDIQQNIEEALNALDDAKVGHACVHLIKAQEQLAHIPLKYTISNIGWCLDRLVQHERAKERITEVLDAIHTQCVASTASDPIMLEGTRNSFLIIGESIERLKRDLAQIFGASPRSCQSA